jgi:lipopolysaccharide export system permease protein
MKKIIKLYVINEELIYNKLKLAMLTYKKYITKSILPALTMLTILLTSLVWITQTLRMVHLIDKGIEIKHFFKLIILLIPSLLFMILPIIGVITVIYVYNTLQDERQLLILRSSGLSNYDLAKPALLVATGMTIFAYYISIYLMPLSYNSMKQELSNFRGGYLLNIINERTFNQISKNSNIYIDSKSLDGTLKGIVLFDNKTPEKRTIIFAKNAKIVVSTPNITEFELSDGMRHSYDHLGHLTKLYFDSLIVAITNENTEKSDRNKTSIELYINEMLWPDSALTLDKQQQLITDGHLRLVWPLFNFAFIFLALSLFLDQPYNRKSHVKQYLITFIPILLVAYFHFTLQKIAYKETNYIFLCYANLFLCIIFSIWKSTRNSL